MFIFNGIDTFYVKDRENPSLFNYTDISCVNQNVGTGYETLFHYHVFAGRSLTEYE
jgi:hypothetical protein